MFDNQYQNVNEQSGSNAKTLIFIGAIVISLIFLLFTGLLGFRTVDAGEVAVVTRWGAVTGRVLEPGAHIITPFAEGTMYYNTRKVIYETTDEEKQKGSDADYKDYPVDTNTKDGQPVNIYYTVRFNVDPTKATEVASTIGNENALVEKIVKTESRIWARAIPREFSAEEIYTGDGTQRVQDEIFKALEPVFAKNGLVLDSVGIREIKFTDQYVAAIETKQIEAVKVETARNVAERAEHEKQATIRQAEAQAQAQQLQATTLTPQYIEIEWIKRWDGKLPQYMTGDASTLIQLPN